MVFQGIWNQSSHVRGSTDWLNEIHWFDVGVYAGAMEEELKAVADSSGGWEYRDTSAQSLHLLVRTGTGDGEIRMFEFD